MSAEPRVLLEFDLPRFVDEDRMRIVQVGDATRLEVLDGGEGWVPWMEYGSNPCLEVVALAVYEAMRYREPEQQPCAWGDCQEAGCIEFEGATGGPQVYCPAHYRREMENRG